MVEGSSGVVAGVVVVVGIVVFGGGMVVGVARVVAFVGVGMFGGVGVEVVGLVVALFVGYFGLLEVEGLFGYL